MVDWPLGVARLQIWSNLKFHSKNIQIMHEINFSHAEDVIAHGDFFLSIAKIFTRIKSSTVIGWQDPGSRRHFVAQHTSVIMPQAQPGLKKVRMPWRKKRCKS